MRPDAPDTPETHADEIPPDAPAADGTPLSLDQVRQRAVGGAAAVAIRGFAIQAAALGGNIVLARLLVPKEFGYAAFGLSLLAPLSFLVSTGLGGAFIADRKAPSRADLQTLVAVQLAGAVVVSGVVAAIFAPIGITGQVTAVMIASLPIMVLRTPGAVMLERDLVYRPLVTVEFVESAAFYAWAVTTAALGWGVWSIATGAIARAVAGSALMLAVGPVGPLWPSFSWQRARHFLGYGTRVQSYFIVILVRDQILNVIIATVGGLRMLGIWTVAGRLLQIPSLVFGSLNRVAFPAMSRLLSGDHDPRPFIERAVILSAVATGAVLVPLTGSAPALIPALLGGKWTDAKLVVPWASAGLMVGGPITVAAGAFLWALRDTAPLKAIVLVSVTQLAVSAALLPYFGITSLGLAWMAASTVDGIVLGTRARRRTGAALFRPLVLPIGVGAVAAGVGWFLASRSATLAWAIVAAVASEAIYLGVIAVVRRYLLLDVLRLFRQALGRDPATA